MPKTQLDAFFALCKSLPKIASELEKMNKLKALELKLKFHGTVEPVPGWVTEVDEILKK